MGSLCGALFGQSQTTTYQPPAELKSAITDILSRASTQSNQPYPQYTPATAAQYMNYVPGLVSPMTPNQVYAGQSIAGLQGYTDPNFAASSALASNAATPIQMQQYTPEAVNQYMNPYMGDVVNAAVQNINQTNAQQQQQVLGNAIQRGAFGGDRAGIAQAELARQQDLANNATIANLLNQGYTQAQGQFNQQQGQDLTTQLQNRGLLNTGAINLANLGTQGQQAALQQAQAQYQYGTAEQQQQQAALSTAYQQYMNQQAFPYQQLSYYAGLASGAAPAMGGSTTGYTPTVAPGTGVLGTFATLNSLSGGSSGVNPLSFLGNAAATAASGGLFADGGRANHAEGGRAGYATGGGPTSQSIVQAYNDYVNLISSGRANPAQIDAAYKKYITAFQNAPAPYDDTTTTTTKTTTTPVAKTDTTPTVDVSNIGRAGDKIGGGNATNSGYSPIYDENGKFTGIGKLAGGGDQGGPVDEYGNNPRAGDTPGFGTNGAGGGYGINRVTPKGVLSDFIGGVDPTTGAQTGIAGAINALVKGNSPGSLNAVLNAPNTVAYGKRADNSAYPNTSTGMTAQEWADKFAGGDISKVSGSVVNGQIDWFRNDNAVANAVHPGALPATKLNELIGPVAQQGTENTDTSGITDPLAGGADLGASKNATIKSGVVDPSATPNTTGLLNAIQSVESGGTQNPTFAVGDGGKALGAFQLHNPAAAQAASELGLNYTPDMRKDPTIAPQLAQQYLSDMFNYTGSVEGAIAAYNMGPGAYKAAVDAGKDPTQNSYTQKVLSTGLVNTDAGVMPPGAAPLPPERPASMDVQTAGPSGLGSLDPQQQQELKQQEDSSTKEDNSTKEDSSSKEDSGNTDHVAGVKEESQSEHNEKRGGLILAHPHHYAAGGYAPISMQYGLPTQDELSQLYADYAGTGVGQLGAQQYAAAAKGLLPSATARKGGRIHARYGQGITAPEDDHIAGDASFYDMGDDETDTSYLPIEKPVPFTQRGFDVPKISPSGLPASYEERHPEEFLTPEQQQAELDRAYNVGKTIMGRMGESPNDVAARVKSEMQTPIRASGTYTAPYNVYPNKPDEGGGDNVVKSATKVASEKTKPTVSQTTEPTAKGVSKVDAAPDDTVQETAPVRKKKGVEVAQDMTRTQSDAAQPGFGYVAPNPADMRNFFGLNYGLSLLSGSSIAAAGDNYAKNILAQQAEQRAQMEAQGRTAQSYGSAQSSQATAGLTGAQEESLRVKPDIFGDSAYVLAGTPQNPRYETIPMGNAGQSQMPSPATGLGDTIDSTLDQYGSNFKRMNKQRFMLKPETATQYQTEFMREQQEAAKVAAAANAGLGDLKTMAQALTAAEGSKMGMGVGSPLANSARRIAYATARALGYQGPSPDSDNPVVAEQELNKIRQFLANAQVGAITHNGAARLVEATANAQPNVELESESGNKLFTSLARQSVMGRDYQKIINAYGGRTGGMGTDVQQAYQDAMPTDRYNKEQDVLQTLIAPENSWKDTSGKTHNLVTDLLDGKRTKNQFDAAVKKYYPDVNNLSRWLVN